MERQYRCPYSGGKKKQLGEEGGWGRLSKWEGRKVALWKSPRSVFGNLWPKQGTWGARPEGKGLEPAKQKGRVNTSLFWVRKCSELSRHKQQRKRSKRKEMTDQIKDGRCSDHLAVGNGVSSGMVKNITQQGERFEWKREAAPSGRKMTKSEMSFQNKQDAGVP